MADGSNFINVNDLVDFGDLDDLLQQSGIVISNANDSQPQQQSHGDAGGTMDPGYVSDMSDVSDGSSAVASTAPVTQYNPFAGHAITPEVKSVSGLDNCLICSNPLYMKVQLPCSHCFCLNCIKGQVLRLRAGQSATCPLCNHSLSTKFVEKLKKNPRTLTNVKVDKKHISDQEVYWFYSGRSHGWWAFDIPSCNEIEALFKRYQRGEDISSINRLNICGMVRTYDFFQMLQVNEYNGTSRGICRVTKDEINGFMESNLVKGMAGYGYK
jgi:hypothetical protein